MRKRFGILSSYNTQCGNASYTHVLIREFSKHCDTEVIPVNFRLLANAHPHAKKARQKHIEELCALIATYDYINIQFESGLFGSSMETAVENVTPLIKASRNLTFTIHRIHNPHSVRPLWKTALRNNRRIMQTLREYSQMRQHKSFVTLINTITHQNNNGQPVSIIVHSQREKGLLNTYYGAQNVVDFPLTFLNHEEIRQQKDNRPALRARVCERYKLDPADKYIGIFGFLAENKAHHTAVNALRSLPNNYKLLIFGSQHPMAIGEYDFMPMVKNPALYGRNNNTYISSLVQLAAEINSASPGRVRFMGNLNDSDFIDALTAMDFVFLPYFETGQGGSGNAALVMEVGAKAVLANNHAFMEFARYYPNCFEFADIGNDVEFAQRVLFWNKDLTENQDRSVARYNIENNILVQKKCFEEGSAGAEALKRELIK
jgi:glycosyltransferase involved in cell wall biosynthesis